MAVSGREHKSKSDLLLLVLSTNIARDVPSMLMRASSLALAWLLDLNTFVQSGQANLVSGPDDDICMCENWQKCQFDDLVNGQLKSTCSWMEDNGCQRLQARRLCTTYSLALHASLSTELIINRQTVIFNGQPSRSGQYQHVAQSAARGTEPTTRLLAPCFYG